MRLVSCNASFAYMLGSSQEQLAQADVASFIHAEDQKYINDAARGHMPPGRAGTRFPVRFMTLLGDLRWGACCLVSDPRPGSSDLLLYALDITDLHKEQQEKGTLQAAFASFMEHSLSGIALFDAFGSLRQANSRWHEQWSQPGAPLLYANALYGNLSFPPQLAQAITRVFNGTEASLPSLEHQTPWGEKRQLRIGLFPLLDEKGKLSGVLMVQDDITETARHVQTELEHAARSAQARYELLRMRDHIAAVMDATPSAIIAIDKSLCVTLWNSMAEQRFDISRRLALGQNLTSVCRFFARHEIMLQKAVQDKTFSQLTLMPYVENGRMEYEDITIYPIETNLETGAIIRIDNVTRRVRLENDLAQADRFSAVGVLASGMAHEINNPLSAILQGLQNMERRLLTELPANAATALAQGTSFKAIQQYAQDRQIPVLLRQMRESSDRIMRIVSNMLHFSRQRDMARAPVKIVTLVAEALEFAKNDNEINEFADFSKITVQFAPSPDLPRVVCCETEIVQVLLQLLRTSIYSMVHRGGVPGPQPTLDVKIFIEENDVAVSIGNNGPHLPQEICKRIFEPFYTTHGMGQGENGIGLALAFFIVTSVHKGSLRCESSPELGTVFTLRLPQADQ